MESKPSNEPDTKPQGAPDQPQVEPPTHPSSEAPAKKPDSNELELFSNYIQCFKNQKAEELMKDKKFQQLQKSHKFWDTQPVPKPSEVTSELKGPLEKKTIDEVSKDPVKLPATFEWTEIDLLDDSHIQEVYTLLYENYVEDDDGYFRFDYSIEFLRWALLPPGYAKDLYFGIRDRKSGRLVGFISGIVVEMVMEKRQVRATEVNFLCVHKKYRHFSMASVLIKEVVRRSNLKNIWQGIYTSGTLLPTPFGQARYYHRSLNPKKLIDVKFSYLPSNQKISTHQKLYSLPEKPALPEGAILRPTMEKDIKQVRALLLAFLSQFKIHQEYNKRECQHWFIHRPHIIESYVLEQNGKITDFFSFYALPSTVLNNPQHKSIRAAYSYYFVNTSVDLRTLYECALIKAKESGYDVYNVLDIMNNEEVFKDLLFSGGDGYLNYYLYNWKLEQPFLSPGQIGIVLM